MKVVVLDGCPSGDYRAHRAAAALRAAFDQPGTAIEFVFMRGQEVASCRGCFGCWLKTPGECVIDDFARELAALIIRSDCLVLVTPVTFGGYSAQLKKGLDRVIGLLGSLFTSGDGQTRHLARYPAFPRILAIGLLDEPDGAAEDIFRRLVARNAFNFYAPAWEAVVLGAGAPDAAATGAAPEGAGGGPDPHLDGAIAGVNQAVARLGLAAGAQALPV